MGEIPEAIARQAWAMAQRVAMEIAGKPSEQRQAAFAIAERSLPESAKDLGVAGDQVEAFIKVQTKAIREIVRDIDFGGRPEGGNA